jgi:hypothetical protein
MCDPPSDTPHCSVTCTLAVAKPHEVRYPGVRTTLMSGNTAAKVEITAELINWGTSSVSGTFQVLLSFNAPPPHTHTTHVYVATISTASPTTPSTGRRAHAPLMLFTTRDAHHQVEIGTLGKAEASSVTLSPGMTQQVVVNMTLTDLTDADLWWPWQMGAPTRHNLTMGFTPSKTGEEVRLA